MLEESPSGFSTVIIVSAFYSTKDTPNNIPC